MKMFLSAVLFLVANSTYHNFNLVRVDVFNLTLAKMEFKISILLQVNKFNYPVDPPNGNG